jgi:hypothetical protein
VAEDAGISNVAISCTASKLLLLCCDESCGSGVDGEATGDVYVGMRTGVELSKRV